MQKNSKEVGLDMVDNDKISELLVKVIDGVTTSEEKQLVYDAIEKDSALRETFNDVIYLKVFSENVKRDFEAEYSGVNLDINSIKTEESDKIEISSEDDIINEIALSLSGWNLNDMANDL
jgi:hypothetical protein